MIFSNNDPINVLNTTISDFLNVAVENYWLAPSPDHPRNFCRTVEEPVMYSSKPATRCEVSSTFDFLIIGVVFNKNIVFQLNLNKAEILSHSCRLLL